jgi:hypothetical protein
VTVWIMETGAYENRGVSAIFLSLDAAKARWQAEHLGQDPQWHSYTDERWSSSFERRGGGMDDCCDIYPMPVTDSVAPSGANQWVTLASDDPGPLHTVIQHNNKHDSGACSACMRTRTLADGTRQEKVEK